MRKQASLRAFLEPFTLGHPRRHLDYSGDVETRQRRRLAHYAGVCAGVVLLFLIPDYLLIRDVFPSVVLCTLGLSAPLLLTAGILAHRGRRTAAELVLLVAFCSLPVWVFRIFGSSRVDHRLLALYGLAICCLMFVWYNATFGVRLWKPTLCYIIVILAGMSMFLRLDELSWRIDLSLGLLVLTAAVMALLSNVFMQRDERGFVSEGQHLLAAIAAGRHDLWAFDIPTGRVDVLRATPSGPRRRYGMTYGHYLALVHPDDRQYVAEYVRQCIDQGESQAPCQYRMAPHSGGSCRWYEGIGKVVERNPAGDPVTVLGMTNNISDRKQLTRQLQQQAEEIARATHAKSEFLATMSHEIRTPLNGVLGMASLLADADLTASQREMVSIIHGSGTALLQILNDVLDFSRIEAGKLSLTEVPFEVRQVAEHCMKSIETAARSKSLATCLSLAPDVPPWLFGDAVHLSTILKHLLSNAVKFTTGGRIDLAISTCGPNGDGGETLRFEVRDTGAGIDPQSQKRLFAPFTQAHGNGLMADSGAGLGLALSKRLVEALGGSIACWSRPGRGTCFTVKAPFTVHAQPHSPSSQPEAGGPLPGEGIRILVAEDNPVNQAVMVKVLQHLGYAASVVANGLEAVDAVKNGNFDIVFMDCEMPGLDGLEATRRIRELPERRQLPIVALSAHSPGEHKALCMAAGMSDYLTKPITREALGDLLRRRFWPVVEPPVTQVESRRGGAFL